MLLLHVSDLHVTEAGQSLKSLWLRAERALAQLERDKFDFIIVTGDLSQRASSAEYAELQQFAEQRLLPMVPASERARVVFVPGNHDVDWSAQVGAPVDLAAARAPDLEAIQGELERYRQSPELSELRLQVGRAGHLGLVRLDRDRYQERLGNVQRFFNSFYGETLAGRGRPFRLLDARPSEHFSAHVFAEEGVAFIGFSSVHRNDKWWAGASISPEAVVAATELLRPHGPGLLRIAVWHHGFSSERGRPDSLTVQDVGMLHAAGFRVGFHGHTHRNSAQLSDLFHERFAIVSTGSFGAGSQDRPDAVGNQVSIVRLTPGSLRVEVLEKLGEAGAYRSSAPIFFDLSAGASRPAPRLEAHARLHRRTLTVQRDGIVRTEVLLVGLQTDQETPLAIVSPPFCAVLEDELAQSAQGPLPVKRQQRPDDRVAFLLQSTPGRRLSRLDWKYLVSNALCLNRGELALLQDRRRFHPNLPEGHDLTCHTVRFDCDRLELSLAYQADAETTIESAFALVEQPVEVQGELHWERNESEERRCTVTLVEGRAELSIAGPLEGRRYGIAFKPSNAGRAYPAMLALDVGEIVRHCIGTSPGSAGSLGQRLGASTERVMAALLREKGVLADGVPLFGNRTTLMGMLWDSGARVLRPAFGRFWTQSWAARFACGEGVAGHAFRMGLPAGWHAEAASGRHASSIIFQRHPQHWVHPRRYRWVLSVPLSARGEAPVGAVTLASEEDEGSAPEQLLSRVARVTATGIKDPSSANILFDLERVLNQAFWFEVSQSAGLTQSVREHAEKVLGRLQGGPEGS